MIDQKNIQQTLGVDVSLSTEMVNALTTWTLIYENKATWLGTDVKSLNLGAAISSEISRSATIEMTVDLGKSPRGKYLAEQFEPVMEKMRDSIEYGCAKGGLILKPYVEGENILVDVVHADHFYPLNFDASGNITAAIFVDQRQVGKYFYTRLERHDSQYQPDRDPLNPEAVVKKVYLVENKAFKSESKDSLGEACDLSFVADWADLEPEATVKNVDKPLFGYFKYPLANNIDTLSPLGVSCFSRAVDLIEEADKLWSIFLWENESAKRALYVDELAFARDDEGDPILPNSRLIRTLETGTSESDLFKDWTPDIREESLLAGLDAILKRIEFNCGLATGTLSDPNSIDKTATEIKASKQRSAATITDTQKAITKLLDQLFYAMDTWATLSKLGGTGKLKTKYGYDDSIIVDKDTQWNQDLGLVGSRTIMSRVEFRIRNFNEDEKTAKAKVEEAMVEANAINQSIFGDEITPDDKSDITGREAIL